MNERGEEKCRMLKLELRGRRQYLASSTRVMKNNQDKVHLERLSDFTSFESRSMIFRKNAL